LDKQQTQLLFDQQNSINDSYAKEIQMLRQQQKQHAIFLQRFNKNGLKLPSTHLIPLQACSTQKKSRQALDHHKQFIISVQNITTLKQFILQSSRQ
jgi:hypothetical protein